VRTRKSQSTTKAACGGDGGAGGGEAEAQTDNDAALLVQVWGLGFRVQV
jgi:hypothetical protein